MRETTTNSEHVINKKVSMRQHKKCWSCKISKCRRGIISRNQTNVTTALTSLNCGWFN